MVDKHVSPNLVTRPLQLLLYKEAYSVKETHFPRTPTNNLDRTPRLGKCIMCIPVQCFIKGLLLSNKIVVIIWNFAIPIMRLLKIQSMTA